MEVADGSSEVDIAGNVDARVKGYSNLRDVMYGKEDAGS